MTSRNCRLAGRPAGKVTRDRLNDRYVVAAIGPVAGAAIIIMLKWH